MSKIRVTLAGEQRNVELNWTPQQGNQLQVQIEGELLDITIPGSDRHFDEIEWIIVNGRPYEIEFDRDLAWIRAHGGLFPLEVRDMEIDVARPHSGDPRVKAPIPGLVVRTLVAEGAAVEAGDPVIVLEAMKMENEIHATSSGVVHRLLVTPGQSVLRHEVLLEIR